jgi:hypothetical protein
MKLYADRAFKAVIIGGSLMVLFCLVCAYLSLLYTQPGTSNVFTNDITVNGSFEQRTAVGGASDIVAGVGLVHYSLMATWADGTPLSFKSEVMMDVVKEVKNRLVSNRYAVAVYSSGTGYKHKMEARKISGEFTGSAAFVTADTSVDSLILMDGNATFKGSLINSSTGRHPTTESETYAVGIASIKQYLNISVPLKTPDDWLGFCAAWNGLSPQYDPMGLMIPSMAEQTGYKLLPDGYAQNSTGAFYQKE